jgi:hypothetical protein
MLLQPSLFAFAAAAHCRIASTSRGEATMYLYLDLLGAIAGSMLAHTGRQLAI